MTKPTISNIEPGRIYNAGYIRGERNFSDPNRFVGFKVGSLNFTNLKQLKQYFGVTNLRDLEFEADRIEAGSVTAEFYDCNGEFFWAAYLWNGSFKVGTSADKLRLQSV